MPKSVFENPFFFFDPELYDQRRRKYALGIFFIFLVSLIWIGSSVLSQYIYTERSFDSPFLVTYLGISLFTLLLPLKYMTDRIGFTKDTTCLSHIPATTYDPFDTENISVVSDYQEMKETKILQQKIKLHHDIKKAHHKRKKNKNKNHGAIAFIDPILCDGDHHCCTIGDYDEDRNQHNTNTKIDFDAVMIQQQQQQQLQDQDHNKNDDGISISASSVSSVFDLNHPGKHWNHSKHMFVAMHIAPVLFIANWLFSASLQATSVVSATVLVSTSCLFVFVLAVLVKEETFNIFKLLGCLLGILGSVLTARHDFTVQDDYQLYDEISDEKIQCTTADCDYNLWGDTLAVLAAVAFASYAVQVRLLCPVDEEIYSMVLLLGYIGLFITIPLLPLAIVLLLRVENLSYETILLILLRGLFDYCISEYLHFRSVVLTNATIATVGLGLTIPMAFIADFIIGKENIISLSSLSGAIAVTAGFLLVNMFDDDNNHHHSSTDIEIITEQKNRSGSELLENGIPMTIIQTSPTSDSYRSKVVI